MPGGRRRDVRLRFGENHRFAKGNPLAVLHVHVGPEERIVRLRGKPNHAAEGFGVNPHVLTAGHVADRLHHVSVLIRKTAGEVRGRRLGSFNRTHHYEGRGKGADETVVTAVYEFDRFFGLRHQFVKGKAFFDEPTVFFLSKGARIRRIRRTDRGILARPHFRVPADVLDDDAGIVATGGVGDHRHAAGDARLEAFERGESSFGVPVVGRRGVMVDLREIVHPPRA